MIYYYTTLLSAVALGYAHTNLVSCQTVGHILFSKYLGGENMGWLKTLGKTLATIGGNYVRDKGIEAVNKHLIVPAMDDHAISKLSSDLLSKYGTEVFYNDFDSFLQSCCVIEHLIEAFRGESCLQPTDKIAFINDNVQRFIDANPQHKSAPLVISRVSEALALIYDKLYESTLGVSPYTDIGRLQRDTHSQFDGVREDTQDILRELRDIKHKIISSPSLSTPGISAIANEEITDCDPAVEDVKKQIQDIESNYQHQGLFTEALNKYMAILQNMLLALSGQPKNQIETLVCTVNCNIALCYSNLGNYDEAFSALQKIPVSIAETSKTYNYVFAIVAVQQSNPLLYDDALAHINQALTIDNNYHRAFMVKQHLRALLSQESVDVIIQDLDAHFSLLLDSLEKNKIAEYYLYRGIINIHYNCFEEAVVDYENALKNGYDPTVGKLNLAIAKYCTSTADLPRDQYVLLPTIKMEPMLEAEAMLYEIIQETKGNPNSFVYLRQAISFYVSACTFIGKPHQLTPIREYLFENQSYDSKRAIIMGAHTTLTKEEIAMLAPTDALFCTCREMLRKSNAQECKQYIAALVDSNDAALSPPVYNLLLQACLLLDVPSEYWRYRTSAERNGVANGLLRSYDAWAYDLEGKIDSAKIIMDEIAETSYDDGLLFNALQFYGRNKMFSEQEALFLRMHNLQKEQQIYIVELDGFYERLTDFFVNQKHSLFAQLLAEFPKDRLTPNKYLRMQGKYYSEINDLDKLITCLSELWDLEKNIQHGFDLAICLYRTMRYEEAIAIGEELEGLASAEEKAKAYWLLSDANFLSGNAETSFNWAKKAHELTLHNPYDKSHQAFFSRAMACNHQEVLSTILEYKETHPVVVDWFHKISVPEDGQDFVTELHKKLEEIDPQHSNYEEHQNQIKALYRTGNIPINLLFQNYGHRLWDLIYFALECKLNIASGHLEDLERAIPDELVVDAQTLIFSTIFGGIDAIKLVPRLYMNYGSVVELQQTYFINAIPGLKELLSWMKTTSNIILVADGFADGDESITTAFSSNFVSCCDIAQQKNIPYVYCDQIAPKFQSVPDLGIANSIQFVSIPALCFNRLKADPDKLATTLHSLLKYCRFVSFTSDTIVRTIKVNNDVVTEELIEPFLCCNADCDMDSFAKVYLGAIQAIKRTDETAALQLAEIILVNTKKVWRRGTYNRMIYEDYNDVVAGMKTNAINQYLLSIINGINHIYSDIPSNLVPLLSDLETCLS